MPAKGNFAGRRSAVVVAGLCALLALSLRAGAAVIYVDDSASGGANNGSSWRNAFIDLQSALAIAQAGDEIRIAQGVYKPAGPGGPTSATFAPTVSMTLRGGYAGITSRDPDANDPATFPSVLSGDLNGDDPPTGSGNHTDNVMHVLRVNAVNALIMSGVTITGGSALGSEAPDDSGAGILTQDSTLLLNQVTIERNYVAKYGAGVFAHALQHPSVVHMSHCTVRFNAQLGLTSSGTAAGVLAAGGSTFDHCRFEGNSMGDGGSVAALTMFNGTISDCVFINNHAREDAGAVSCSGALIERCIFIDNTSGYWAGALLSSGDVVIQDCQFLHNGDNIEGGAITQHIGNLTLTNCYFAGNYADTGGAIALIWSQPSSANIVNCTFVANRALFTTGGGVYRDSHGTLALRDCILWNNSDPAGHGLNAQVFAAPGTLTASHCIVQGWPDSLTGDTNFGLDPHFIDADGPDNIYGTPDDNPRLSANSPARDSGDNAALPPDTYDLDHDGNTTEPLPYDLDAHRRIVNGTIDRGCYEFQTCSGDIAPLADQGDGQVNVDDLLAVIVSWGACPSPCPADIVHNQRVDVDDLLAVILGWGVCP